MNDDIFGGRTSATGLDVPHLAWANGKVQAKKANDKYFGPLVGFYSEALRDEEFDVAMTNAGIARLDIKHSGDGNIKPYWYFGDALTLYPLATGLAALKVTQALRPGTIEAMGSAGIAVRWPKDDVETGVKGRSVASIRVLPLPLLEVGYMKPLQLSAKSTMSDRLLQALAAHIELCEKADKIVPGENTVYPFELALPFVAGGEISVGKANASSTVIPFVADHPASPSADYIKGLYRSDALYEAVKALWPVTKQWAQHYNALSLQLVNPAVGPAVEAPASDMPYFRMSRDTLNECIRAATSYRQLQELRAATLDSRDGYIITVDEQVKLADLIDECIERLSDDLV